eukprot:5632555-Pyramimonas_sp.AAC.1
MVIGRLVNGAVIQQLRYGRLCCLRGREAQLRCFKGAQICATCSDSRSSAHGSQPCQKAVERPSKTRVCADSSSACPRGRRSGRALICTPWRRS